MDLSPGGIDRKVKEVTLDRFSKVIELAEFFKPMNIVFHPGYEKWKFDGNVSLWLESSLETWRPLVRQAASTGLTIAIENVFEETPDSLVLLLKEIHSPHFRFCFDTGHHHVFSNVSLRVWSRSWVTISVKSTCMTTMVKGMTICRLGKEGSISTNSSVSWPNGH